MAETTYLRYIRLKCGITLMELEEHSSFSNQYLSLLDIILSRAEELMKLAQICYEHKGHLLDAVEVDPNEL